MPTEPRRRSLELRTETLAELSPDELATIDGARPTPVVKTLPLAQCLSLDCWNSEPCPGTSMC